GRNVAWRAGSSDLGGGREGGKNLKLLAMEPPAELKQRIISGEFGDGIVVHEVESSPVRMAAMVDACDIIFHAARFGESFGYSMAEGMAAGKPVITRTIPWGDNAPVELVEHGTTGFVCCSLEGMTQALHLLVADQELRNAMGAAGRDRIHRLASPERECRILAAALGEDAEVLRTRWSEILEFAQTLPQCEWNVIEKTHPQLFEDAPALVHREKKYTSRYKARKRLSAIRADLRSLLGRPAYG
ncbi:MAG: glycosyltransferase, partial [Deltaproteobacteria bacterium]